MKMRVLTVFILSFVCMISFNDTAGLEPIMGKAVSIGEDPNHQNDLKQEETEVSRIRRANGLCLAEHNAQRRQNGKKPLVYDTRLEKAAQNHNNVMTSQNCFSHQCPGEQNFADRITSAGYKWTSAAENIAAGQTNCASVLTSWMGDKGHRDNVLGNYANVGCAMNKCPSCDYQYYWTCDYASPM